MDQFVREHLNSLLQKHVAEATISALDDVVLDYVVEVLTNLGDADENSFDVDQLHEMIAAYVPEFTQVDRGTVCEWVFTVAHDIQKQVLPAKQEEIPLHNLVSPPKCDGQDSNSTPSESTSKPEEKCGLLRCEKSDTDEQTHPHELAELSEDLIDSDHLVLLMEMFPDCTKSDIIKLLEIHKGDLDLCIQALLETSNSDKKQQPTKIEGKYHSKSVRRDPLSVKDDDHLKHTILSKQEMKAKLETFAHGHAFKTLGYEFVDTKEDKRSHRPCMPAQEPKKLVRYRDNQVVNTKGERFTVQTKRDQEGEEMKKTYVNIKPLRKYRFH